ncbi:MAG: methyltransferase domain-containing protein [Pedobacter sp.]|uniref:methyltransferase domain-containing protein n=1 Tax=Pedobacter sp. TaxID=1411316 RepID=UPI0035617617
MINDCDTFESPILPAILPMDYYDSDQVFDSYFPDQAQRVSEIHWTPLAMAKEAASFLSAVPGSKILDIGSGIGKFCIAGGHFFPDSEFHGVEQRMDLVEVAIRAKRRSMVDNVHFMHANFTQLSLNGYEGIYFYNSFAENLSSLSRIDEAIEYSYSLYEYYSNFLYNKLSKVAKGTRLATYYGDENDVPTNFELVGQHPQKPLKMWICK